MIDIQNEFEAKDKNTFTNEKAKNDLEKYCFEIKHAAEDENYCFEIKHAAEDVLQWLENNSNGEAKDFKT